MKVTLMKPPAPINKPMKECYPEIADDEDEQLLADVRRYWLGRLGIILTGAVLVGLLIGFAASLPYLTKSININYTTQFKAVVSLLFLITGLLIVAGTLVTIWIYNQSRMLITNENVVEIRQMSLFSRKVAHLNMINVEDVSVVRKGILQTLFNYGTMTIETAGEQQNFVFLNTPTPDEYRKIVINAHEQSIERIGKLGSLQRVELTHGGF
jgi:membrane protein YdbS with pleckstrin-like domain